MSARQQMLPALALRGKRLVRLQCQDRFPAFGRGNQGGGVLVGQVGAEVARAPQVALRIVPTAFLDAVEDIWQRVAVDGKGLALAVDIETQRGQPGTRSHLIAMLHRRHGVGAARLVIHRRVVEPKLDRRPQFQTHGSAVGQRILDVNGVLPVRQQHALFDDRAAQFVAPDRQAHVEAKFGQIGGAVDFEHASDAFLAAEPSGGAVGQAHEFRQVIQHHLAPQGRRQGSDQEPMIAPGCHAGHRTGRIAAQAIGHQPFAGHERLQHRRLGTRPRHAQNPVGPYVSGSIIRGPRALTHREQRHREEAA